MPGAEFSRGARVTLRTVEAEDADVVQRAYNEPAFQDGFLIESPTNRDAMAERIEERADEEDSLYLLACVDGDPVGGVSLRDVRQSHGMLAYWLLPEARGRGYATESAALLLDHAFDEMGLHRVFAWTIDDNEASQELLRRLGFSHEGMYREHVFSGGEYRDTVHYGLLTSEWNGSEEVLDDA